MGRFIGPAILPDCGFENSLVGVPANIGAIPSWGEAALMVQLGELMMILELHRQGLSVTAIARRTGRDPKTVRKYIERGVEAPVYGRARWAGRVSSPLSWVFCANG